MRLFRPLLLLASLAAVAIPAARSAVTVGEPAPDFTLVDLNGQSHRLSEYRGKTVILEWTNPTCPIVGKHYKSGNMPSLQREATAQGVVWLSINSGYAGSWGDFAPAKAADWLKSHGAAPTAYLRDLDGRVGRLYGATATPDMYVISGAGTLVYAGAIDSIPSSDESDIPHATNYVRAALDSLKAGQPVAVPTSHAYGCSIKY
jgi:AhpC/TSA family